MTICKWLQKPAKVRTHSFRALVPRVTSEVRQRTCRAPKVILGSGHQLSVLQRLVSQNSYSTYEISYLCFSSPLQASAASSQNLLFLSASTFFLTLCPGQPLSTVLLTRSLFLWQLPFPTHVHHRIL